MIYELDNTLFIGNIVYMKQTLSKERMEKQERKKKHEEHDQQTFSKEEFQEMIYTQYLKEEKEP